jgi:hypothetical protein
MGLGLMIALTCAIQPDTTMAAPAQLSNPVISRVMPNEVSVGKVPQTMTVTGQDFQARLVLSVKTPEGAVNEYKDDLIVQRTETSFRVTLVFPTQGKYAFVVTNPDGGTSEPFLLDVRVPAKPATPLIETILPEQITKGPEPQNIKVTGQRFGPGLKAIVTDPMGMEVLDPLVRDQTPTSFTLNVRLETAGTYNLVVSTSAGASSNIATIVVR